MLLSKIYPLLALIPTAFCGVSLGQESPWKLFFLLLIYPGFTLALFALHFIVAYFWSLILKRFPEPETPKKIYSYMTVATEDILCRFAGAKLEGFDPSALPEGPFLLVSNHLSNFDPIVTSVWLSKRKSVFISNRRVLYPAGRVSVYRPQRPYEGHGRRLLCGETPESGLLRGGLSGRYPK